MRLATRKHGAFFTGKPPLKGKNDTKVDLDQFTDSDSVDDYDALILSRRYSLMPTRFVKKQIPW